MRAIALVSAAAVLLVVALLIPDADRLFSFHMLQHLLLIAVAAPLLALRRRVSPPPVAAWLAFVAVFLFWHWPVAFQWAAGNAATELIELGSILATAFLFWSAAFAADRLSAGARALFVMTAAVATDLPGVIMLFAPRAFCVMPGENAPAFGLTPLEDQQIAGLLMWVPANLVFFVIATWLFSRWISPRPLVSS
ncbi:MAG TPA: cytochrome c oxidase assembly protein [Rhizomicrobium sp.]|nr:cytochrome c oxidase assembly protein [Rhizomicrobium sp.]